MIEYQIIGRGYKDTADVPKGRNIYYHRSDSGVVIPSIPKDNIECGCGNMIIDTNYWRLAVFDFEKLKKKKGTQLFDFRVV